MIGIKTKDVAAWITGPNDSGEYQLHLSATGHECDINLSVPQGMTATALLMAASVKLRKPSEYQLSEQSQKVLDTQLSICPACHQPRALAARLAEVERERDNYRAANSMTNEFWSSAEARAAEAEARGREAGLREAAKYHQDEIDRLNEVIASNDEYAARTGKDASPSNVICYDKRAAHETALRAILARAALEGK